MSKSTDLRQTKQHADYLKKTGWIVEKIDDVYIFVRKIPLTPFSIVKIQRPNKLPVLERIDKLAKKYRAFSISIEPKKSINNEQLSISNYQLSQSPYLPTKTIQLDLTQPAKRIYQQFKKKCRYCLRKADQSYHISIYESKTPKQIKSFYRAWKKAAGWQMLIPGFKNIAKLKKVFGKHALFLSAITLPGNNCDTSMYRNINKKVVAGAVILTAKKTAYYYYAFTSQKGRETLAQYKLVWKAIKITKKIGCRVFDFEGIYDSRFPTKSWKGFSHFKKSFGGKKVDYPGCFVKRRLPF